MTEVDDARPLPPRSPYEERTHGRELALRALYQLDLLPALPDGELRAFLRDYASSDGALAYGAGLVEGVRAAQQDLDARIAGLARNWELSRMAVIDRNVLRLGAYELLHRPDVPPNVAIDEAVELAKKYSTKGSGGFVNGILDQIRKRGAKASAQEQA